jgi:PAS domain S-box-containing protein
MARILIVEDSPTQAQELGLVLEGAGFEVELAADGEQGLERLSRSEFDLVVSDIVMPGLSGFDFCRKVKADPKRRDVPVVLLTSLNNPLDIIQGLECGADNFLTKPYEPEHLIARVNRVLRNKPSQGDEKFKLGVEIFFLGRKFTITSDKEQILSLLISTFEDIVRTNRELEASQAALAAANAKIERYARQLEDRADASEEKYRRLMEEAGDAILICDDQNVLIEVNRQASVLFGRPQLEITGHEMVEFVQPSHADVLRKLSEEFWRDGRISIDALLLQRPDGTSVIVDGTASVVTLADRRFGLAILRDVSERKRLEAQLLQAQKMEAVGQLAGGVAHDFNNLLTAIVGYADLLKSHFATDQAGCRDLEEIRKAGERASGLTRQLLAFSRKQILQPTTLDVNALIRNIMTLLRRLIREDIELEARLQPVPKIKADPGQVEQILVNLAVNASDAMPEGGRLIIETASADIAESHGIARIPPGTYLTLAISDTGIGMTPEVQKNIFEPFFTTKARTGGTGLGLATVYGIVKQSEGYISVDSQPGRGTTFTIYFPPTTDTAPTRATRVVGEVRGGSETILLVEDEMSVRLLTRALLERSGYKVLDTGNPKQAVELADRYDGPIDLLITDVVMPGLGGREVFSRVAARRPEIKVLFMSGYTDDTIIRHGVGHAETRFLQKPFTAEGLARKVRETLDGALALNESE